MKRGALSLDLVLSVLFLFQMFAIAGSFSDSVARHAEVAVATPSCRLVGTLGALSYGSASDVFGVASYYDYSKVDPGTYSVSVSGSTISVTAYGFETNTSCSVVIP